MENLPDWLGWPAVVVFAIFVIVVGLALYGAFTMDDDLEGYWH